MGSMRVCTGSPGLPTGDGASEHLHHEHLAPLLAEADGRLLAQDLEQTRMLTRDLSAHGVGRDLQLGIRVEPIDEALDGRDVVGVERIQADLDSCTHYLNSQRKETPNCRGSPSCV